LNHKTHATKTLPALPQSFFARPAEVVAPELIGCLLVQRQPSGELLWGLWKWRRIPKTSPPATAIAIALLATKPCLVSLGVFMSI